MAITSALATSFKTQMLTGGHCFAATVTPTGSAASGAFTVTAVSSMTGISVGMNVTGTNIPVNTIVAQIVSSSSFILSQAATGTISAGTLTISGDVFAVALITAGPTGSYGAASTNYNNITSNGDEVTGTGYTAGGFILINMAPASSGTTAYASFASNPTWTGASFSTDGLMIYNTGNRVGVANACVAVVAFGTTQTFSSSTFAVTLPAFDASDALIQVA